MLRILYLLPAVSFIAILLLNGCNRDHSAPEAEARATETPQTYPDKVRKSDIQWQEVLSDEQFRVLRQCGTEPAFANKYWNEKREGTYSCAGCGLELFNSQTKSASGSGWPSFYQPIDPARIGTKEDRSGGMVRTEVVCNRCEGHLGHVFSDGPEPTGLRYCINSAALNFHPAEGRQE